MTISKTKKAFIHGFGYPVYAVDVVGQNALVVAGGGGAVKTGVPNRIDVVEVRRCFTENIQNAKISTGLDTGTEAVMSLTVTNMSGYDSFVTSLEGRSCVEYFVTNKTTHTQASHRLSESDVDAHNAISKNATEPQSNDACHERLVRKRKCSSHGSTNAPLSVASHVPTGETEQDEHDLVQWNLTKLRQFTLPSFSPSCINNANATKNSENKRTRTASSSVSGMPTCVAAGGPAGCWFAVGSDSGSVFMFDRIKISHPTTNTLTRSVDSMKPFIVYPDVSVGLSAGVCALALSTTTPVTIQDNQNDSPVLDSSPPCLATICEQPSWSVVHVWSLSDQIVTSLSHLPDTSQQNNDVSSHPRSRKAKTKKVMSSTKVNTHFFASSLADSDAQQDVASGTRQPYAVACCSKFSTGSTPPPSPVVPNRESLSERSSYRFKHCQFLKCHLNSSSSTDPVIFTASCNIAHTSSTCDKLPCLLLVTTMQPLCANRKSVSRVIVWPVPIPTSSSAAAKDNLRDSSNVSPLQLSPLTDIALPAGDLPACLAVHPSRSRSLIGVGTMDGRVEVYFLSPRTHTLTCVYSMKDAHPIFVTSLTFLPVQLSHACLNCTSLSPNNSAKCPATVPIASGELSYDLVSVSVDRMLCWHSGPSCIQINRLAHGISADPVGLWNRGRRFVITMLVYLGFIFFIPILLSLVDTMCYGRL